MKSIRPSKRTKRIYRNFLGQWRLAIISADLNRFSTANKMKMKAWVHVRTCNVKNAVLQIKWLRIQYTRDERTLEFQHPIMLCKFVHSIRSLNHFWETQFSYTLISSRDLVTLAATLWSNIYSNVPKLDIIVLQRKNLPEQRDPVNLKYSHRERKNYKTAICSKRPLIYRGRNDSIIEGYLNNVHYSNREGKHSIQEGNVQQKPSLFILRGELFYNHRNLKLILLL